jgi:hypothetical protein
MLRTLLKRRFGSGSTGGVAESAEVSAWQTQRCFPHGVVLLELHFRAALEEQLQITVGRLGMRRSWPVRSATGNSHPQTCRPGPAKRRQAEANFQRGWAPRGDIQCLPNANCLSDKGAVDP